MESFDKKDWFEYINKLNDRELSKRNASGLTMWALSGFIGLILIKIIYLIPKLIKSQDFLFNSILVFTILINFSVVFAMLIYGYLVRFFELTPVDIKNNNKNDYIALISIFRNLFLSIVMFVGSFGNTLIAINHEAYKVNLWPFIVIGVYYWINLIVDFSPIFKNRVGRDFIRNANKIGSVNTSNMVIVIYGLMLITNIISIINPYVWNLISTNIAIVEFCLYIFGLILSLLILHFVFKSYLKGNWLEELEKQIIVNNIEAEKIREIFKRYYMDL